MPAENTANQSNLAQFLSHICKLLVPNIAAFVPFGARSLYQKKTCTTKHVICKRNLYTLLVPDSGVYASLINHIL